MSGSGSSDGECMKGTASESSGNSKSGNEAVPSAATAGMSDEQLARMLTRKHIRWGLMLLPAHPVSVLSLKVRHLLLYALPQAGEGEA